MCDCPYKVILAARNGALRDAINGLLREAMRDGSLERIFREWNVWNDDQPDLHRRVLAGIHIPAVVGFDEAGTIATLSAWQAARDAA